jgi:hypothetical protein
MICVTHIMSSGDYWNDRKVDFNCQTLPAFPRYLHLKQSTQTTVKQMIGAICTGNRAGQHSALVTLALQPSVCFIILLAMTQRALSPSLASSGLLNANINMRITNSRR